MECEEEELEPWQRQTPEVNLLGDGKHDDDDDEPIFVGELSTSKGTIINTRPSMCSSLGMAQLMLGLSHCLFSLVWIVCIHNILPLDPFPLVSLQSW